MVYMDCKELYKGNILSQNASWEKLNDAVEEALKTCEDGEGIEISFGNVTVQSPWMHENFLKLLRNDKVHMQFTNRAELVNHIKVSAILNGGNPEHVRNIEVEKPKEKTVQELKVESNGEDIMSRFNLNGGRYEWIAKDKYRQIYNSSTLDYIRYAIDKLNKDTGITEYYMDLNGIQLSDVVIQSFADAVKHYESIGINISIDISDEKYIKTFHLSMHKVASQVYTPKQRIRAIRANLVKGNPGMLIKYKKSKAVDSFGRHGKGEIVSSRIAVFRELKQLENDVVFVVDVYNNNYFYTKCQWMSEHDNESLGALVKETLEIKMEELGLLNMYFGTSYHFIEPIQQDIVENVKVIYGFTERGTNIYKTCTIPERMKIVFDDWGVEYDKDKLEEYIRITAERLKQENE